MFPVSSKSGFVFSVAWIALTLVGGFFVSLFCVRQTDLKSLITYVFITN